MIRYDESRSDGPSAFGPAAVGLLAGPERGDDRGLLARARAVTPIRSSAATFEPVARGWPRPCRRSRRGSGSALICSVQRAKSGEVALTASIPAAAIRTSSNAFAFFEKKPIAPSAYGLTSSLSAATAIRPTAVVPTSGLPPGVWAKPPVVGS